MSMSRNDKGNYKGCVRAGRCSEEDCDPSECDNFESNHKKFRDIIKDLPTKLTAKEMARRAEEAAHLEEEITVAETDFKARKKTHDAHIAELKARMSKNLSLVRSKQQDREIVCEEVYDYADNIYFIRRTDTGDLIEKRELSEQEIQIEADQWEQDNPEKPKEEPEGEDLNGPNHVPGDPKEPSSGAEVTEPNKDSSLEDDLDNEED